MATWTVSRDETVRTVWLNVVDAEPTVGRHGKREVGFIPSHAKFTERDDLREIAISGPMIRKDGKPGDTRIEVRYTSRSSVWEVFKRPLADAPGWVQDMAAQLRKEDA